MFRTFLFAKIHRATVTAANVDYMGSITIDEDLLAATGIRPYERVQVVDVDNGERLETYVIPGTAGSGAIELNGAAARLVQVGDKVIIMAYAQVIDPVAEDWSPVVVMVDERNRVTETRGAEQAGEKCPNC
jgi:aspartate 1-decarboxylase